MEEYIKQSALPYILQNLLNITHGNETEHTKVYMERIMLSAIKIELCDDNRQLTSDTSFLDAVNAYHQHRYHLNNPVRLPSKLQVHTETTPAYIRHIDELPEYMSQRIAVKKLEADFVRSITTWTKTYTSVLLNTMSHLTDLHPVDIEQTIRQIIYQATRHASIDEDSYSDWENLTSETESYADTAEDVENYYESPYDPHEAYNGRTIGPLELILGQKGYRTATAGTWK
jgi:hypothetical protein